MDILIMESFDSKTNSKSEPLVDTKTTNGPPESLVDAEITNGPRDQYSRRKAHMTKALKSFRGINDQVGFSDEYQKYGTGAKSFNTSILAICLYLLIGSITYSVWVEDWNIIDAMYFTTVTFTTVGYGDIVPNESIGLLIFTTFFVLFGITVLGSIALSIIFDQLFTMYEDASKKIKSDTNQHYVDLFDKNKNGTIDAHEKSTWMEFLMIIVNNIPLLIALFIPSFVIGYIEKWSLLESLYFCAITATTGKNKIPLIHSQGPWTCCLLLIFYILS
jgi:hypothetical protein